MRADVLDHYEVEGDPKTVAEAERQLDAWGDHVCEDIRPHQALGYLTANEFYAQWLAEQSQERRVSDMS